MNNILTQSRGNSNLISSPVRDKKLLNMTGIELGDSINHDVRDESNRSMDIQNLFSNPKTVQFHKEIKESSEHDKH